MERSIRKHICGTGNAAWTVQDRVNIVKLLNDRVQDTLAHELGHLLQVSCPALSADKWYIPSIFMVPLLFI